MSLFCHVLLVRKQEKHSGRKSSTVMTGSMRVMKPLCDTWNSKTQPMTHAIFFAGREIKQYMCMKKDRSCVQRKRPSGAPRLRCVLLKRITGSMCCRSFPVIRDISTYGYVLLFSLAADVYN